MTIFAAETLEDIYMGKKVDNTLYPIPTININTSLQQ